MLIAPHLAAKTTTFSIILTCVLHQNALHLAPKRIAFFLKTQATLHQNALHLAPKRIAFCIKTQAILHQNAPKLAANSPQSGVNGALFKLIFILPAWTTNPF